MIQFSQIISLEISSNLHEEQSAGHKCLKSLFILITYYVTFVVDYEDPVYIFQ